MPATSEPPAGEAHIITNITTITTTSTSSTTYINTTLAASMVFATPAPAQTPRTPEVTASLMQTAPTITTIITITTTSITFTITLPIAARPTGTTGRTASLLPGKMVPTGGLQCLRYHDYPHQHHYRYYHYYQSAPPRGRNLTCYSTSNARHAQDLDLAADAAAAGTQVYSVWFPHPTLNRWNVSPRRNGTGWVATSAPSSLHVVSPCGL